MRRSSLAALLLLLSFGPALAEEPVIVDGDTFRLGATNYRLYGIDAPELAQVCRRGGLDWLCGHVAAAYLRDLVAGQPLTCEARGRDIYGRIAAVCSIRGVDINREMVRAGMAWAYVYYSLDYEDSEAEAAIMGRGVWESEAVHPWEWRLAQPKR